MKRKWPLVALAGAQFIMVLDQSVMNVSISALQLAGMPAWGLFSRGPGCSR